MPPDRVLQLGATWAGGFSLLAAGLWLRASSSRTALVGDYPTALTGDGAYHLHRALRTAQEFPHAPVFDPLMHWPEGAYCHWPPGYDQLLALWPWLFGCAGDEVRAAGVIVWVPVVLGLVTIGLTCTLCASLSHRSSGRAWLLLGVTALAGMVPIGVRMSLVGNTDHHVLEGPLVISLVLWLVVRLRQSHAGLAWELSGATLLWAGVYLFNVSLLYSVPVALVLLARALHGRSSAPQWVGSGALAFGVAAGVIAWTFLPGLRVHGRWFAFAYPSLLYPLCMLAVALALTIGHGLAWRLLPERSDPRAVGARALAAGGLLLLGLAGLGAWDTLRDPIEKAVFGHMLRANVSMQGVDEAEPLLSRGLAWPVYHFGALAYASPVLLPAGIFWSLRRARGAALAMLTMGGWLLLLSMMQQRFVRALFPLLVVWSALGVYQLLGRWMPRPAWMPGPALLLVTLALGLADEGIRGRMRLESEPRPKAVAGASAYLSEHNHVRADGTRAGVLVDWGRAHHMMWPARAGVVANGFLYVVSADGVAQVRRALTGDVARALHFMEARDLGWLVTGAAFYQGIRLGPQRRTLLRGGPAGGMVDLDFVRQVPMAVTALAGSGVASRGVRHAAQFAPRWASEERAQGVPFYLPALWAYERVAGARLAGKAPGRAIVEARINLKFRGHDLPYRAWAVAEGDGSFEVVVPLETNRTGEFVETGPYWTLVSDHGPIGRCEVTLEQVRNAGKVAVDAYPR